MKICEPKEAMMQERTFAGLDKVIDNIVASPEDVAVPEGELKKLPLKRGPRLLGRRIESVRYVQAAHAEVRSRLTVLRERREELRGEYESRGIKPLAILPGPLWRRLVEGHEWFSFRPNRNGSIYIPNNSGTIYSIRDAGDVSGWDIVTVLSATIGPAVLTFIPLQQQGVEDLWSYLLALGVAFAGLLLSLQLVKAWRRTRKLDAIREFVKRPWTKQMEELFPDRVDEVGYERGLPPLYTVLNLPTLSDDVMETLIRADVEGIPDLQLVMSADSIAFPESLAQLLIDYFQFYEEVVDRPQPLSEHFSAVVYADHEEDDWVVVLAEVGESALSVTDVASLEEHPELLLRN